MYKYGVILTVNLKALKFKRFINIEDAEQYYQKKKNEGYGVVKVEIEKAHELLVNKI